MLYSVWVIWIHSGLRTSMCEVAAPNGLSWCVLCFQALFGLFLKLDTVDSLHCTVSACLCVYLCECVRACWLGGWGGGVYMMLHSAWPELCVLYVLLCTEERGRATRHGSGQECATWVGCTIEPGSLRVVNGTGVTPCTLPAGWWPPHNATAVRSS